MGIFRKKKKSRRKYEPDYRRYDAISDRKRAESRQTFRRTVAAVFFAFLFLFVINCHHPFLQSLPVFINFLLFYQFLIKHLYFFIFFPYAIVFANFYEFLLLLWFIKQ